MSQKNIKPFLKWAGGKTQLLEKIGLKFPSQSDEKFTYIEPFVGSGAVLFWALNNYPNIEHAVINDINSDLINAYDTIKNGVEILISILAKWEIEYHMLAEKQTLQKEYYYLKREAFNTKNSDQTTQAALFIFLNRTCFNGLYRVNKKNQFNVPIGSYRLPVICDKKNLKAINKILQRVEILNGDFCQTLNYVTDNSFFYFDPPYKPLSTTSSFNSYSNNNFNDSEQIRLKKFCDTLDALNCRWILSNSDVKDRDPDNNFFDDLFKHYQIERVAARRNINTKASKRGEINELLITNSTHARC